MLGTKLNRLRLLRMRMRWINIEFPVN